jgi:hypothetical protein
MEYIQYKLWEKVENSKTKIAQRVRRQLERDILQVVSDKDVFWIEPICSYIRIPNFVYQYVVKFYKKLGYKYNYDN